MKDIRQFGIIMIVTFLGELIKYFVDLPIPASIYGLCLMLLLLMTKVIKIENVKETGMFFIEIMTVTLIPITVGLIVSWNELKEMLVPLLVISISTTILVMVVSGQVVQFVIDKGDRGNSEGGNNERNSN